MNFGHFLVPHADLEAVDHVIRERHHNQRQQRRSDQPAHDRNRLGKNTNVFLASAELAAIASKLGKIPTVAEYHEAMGIVNKDSASIYKYLNFDQIEEYANVAKGVTA